MAVRGWFVGLLLCAGLSFAKAADCTWTNTANFYGTPLYPFPGTSGPDASGICADRTAFWVTGYGYTVTSCAVVGLVATLHIAEYSGWYEYTGTGAECAVDDDEDDPAALVTVADATETFWVMLTIWVSTAGLLYMRKAL